MLGQEIFVLKMNEENIYELANKMIAKNSNNKKVQIKIIGARDREKIEEKLFTDEEKESMIEKNDLMIILPEIQLKRKRLEKYKNI